MPATKEKFELFIRNLNIKQEEIHQYRVFVPFNVCLPHVIVKAVNPESLESKRLKLRIGKWNKYLPFP